MTGEYIWKARPGKPAPSLECRYQIGPYDPVNTGNLALLPPSQVTRTWVTTRDDQLGTKELADDLRIFRNGFTSSDPVYDRGHEFSTSKTSMWFSHMDAYTLVRNARQQYDGWIRGPLVPDFREYVPYVRNPSGYLTQVRDPYPAMPDTSMDVELGTQAVKATIPTMPHANFSAAVGELLVDLPREFMASFMEQGTQYFRGLGSEYLSLQFGWTPFVNDVIKIISAFRNATKILLQLERDSGRQVRRRFTFPPDVTVNSWKLPTSGGPYLWHGADWYPATEQRDFIQKTERIDRKVWFSGAYTYYLGMDKTLLSKLTYYARESDLLIGLGVTPATLWELAPWSWLADWFGTIGTVMDNASALSSDNLVMRYGYLMVHTKHDISYQVLPGLVSNRGVDLPASTATFSRETKRRIKATPYGFGLTDSELSPKQWSILIALGLARDGNHLN